MPETPLLFVLYTVQYFATQAAYAIILDWVYSQQLVEVNLARPGHEHTIHPSIQAYI